MASRSSLELLDVLLALFAEFRHVFGEAFLGLATLGIGTEGFSVGLQGPRPRLRQRWR